MTLTLEILVIILVFVSLILLFKMLKAGREQRPNGQKIDGYFKILDSDPSIIIRLEMLSQPEDIKDKDYLVLKIVKVHGDIDENTEVIEDDIDIPSK